MELFGFDLTSIAEYWLLTCLCTGLADGIVRGFWRAYKEYQTKKEASKNE